MPLKLFVWEGEGVLTDYSDGMICVLAESLEEALKLIEHKSATAKRCFPVDAYRVVTEPEAFICWGGG